MRRVLRLIALLMFAMLALFAAPVTRGAAITVTDPGDTGPGTLRDAIATANSNGEADTITFDTAAMGTNTISLTSLLVLTEDGTTIDGLGAATTPQINIDGSGIPCGSAVGIGITSNGNTIQGLALYGVNNSGTCTTPAPALGITGNNNTISNNYIGLDAGLSAIGNGGFGVAITSGGSSNTIQNNTIGRNAGNAIRITDSGTDNNQILNNFIGVDASNTDIGNDDIGVAIVLGASSNTIQNNAIGFNSENGIRIADAAQGNQVIDNFIGGDDVGNAFGNDVDGIDIRNNSFDNTIQDNIIRFNGNNGIDVRGPSMSFAPPTTTRNTISGNTITDNGNDGIQIIFQASDNLIENNIIGGNAQDGMRIADLAAGNEVRNNLIGVDASNTANGNGSNGILIENEATNNTIEGNAIRFNAVDGITIVGTTTTPLLANTTLNTISGNTITDNVSDGITIIDGALSNTVNNGNTISDNGDDGIQILGTDTTLNTISSNTITNNAQDGVIIGNGASDNTVNNNTIGENTGAGISIQGSGTDNNEIRDNFIGVDTINTDIGNGETGIRIVFGAQSNIVEGNTVGRNTLSGIIITNSGTDSSQVIGNFIGVDASNANIANGLRGITIADGASNSTIQGNTIANNFSDGINVVDAGTSAQILSNSIFDNAGLGIDLNGDGVTPNDGSADTDAGPNDLLNFPVISTVETIGAVTTVEFRVDTSASTVTVEFFENTTCDPTGFGEGETLQDTFTNVPTNTTVTRTLSATVADGVCVTATTTDTTARVTSEFSLGVESTAPTPDVGVTKTASANSITVGDTFEYSITVENLNATVDAAGVTLTDTLPSEVDFESFVANPGNACTFTPPASVDCALGTLPGGASQTIVVEVRANTSGSVTNTATGVTTDTDADPTNNSDSVTITIVTTPAPDVSVSKIASVTTAIGGDTFDYTITVENVGTADATNTTLTDVLPPEVTFLSFIDDAGGACTFIAPDQIDCAFGTLLVGDTLTVEFDVTASNTVGNAVNLAQVSADVDVDTSNNAASVSVALNGAPTLTFTPTTTNTPTVTPTPTATLASDDDDDDDQPQPTLRPTQNQPTVIPPTAIPPTFVLPTAFVPTVIPPTAIPPTVVPATVIPPTAIPPTVIPPTAIPPTAIPPTAIPPTAIPPTAIPPTAFPPTAVPPTLALGTDIAVTQVIDIVGTDTILTDVDVINLSSKVIFDLRLVEEFLGDEFELVVTGDSDGEPIFCRQLEFSITCDVGQLPPGLSETFTFLTQGQLDLLLTSQTRITGVNVDDVIPSEPYVIKVVSPAFAQPETDIVYTIRVINPSLQVANDVVLTDEIPAGLVVTRIEASPGTARVTDGVLSYRRQALRPGDVFTVTVTVRLAGNAPGGPVVTNNACLDYREITTPVCDRVPLFLVSELPTTGQSAWGWGRWVALAAVLSLTSVGVWAGYQRHAKRHR